MIKSKTRRQFLSLAVTLFAVCACATVTVLAHRTAHAETALGQHLNGLSRAEVLQLGEKIYRQGILPSGEMMQAVVKGDVPVDGRMFTCTSCHLRSGVGVGEGTVRTPPVDGSRLYAPMSKFKGIPRRSSPRSIPVDDVYRPAYTDETLARVLRTGEDPAGRKINDAMPLYLLNDRDAAILVYYLKNLSTGTQPGVTDTSLRFATVITDQVAPEDREAMLSALQAFIGTWRPSRSLERSSRAESYVAEGTSSALRTLSLAVWELKGPAETWRKQLEEYYRKEPVFALLAGMTSGEWTPVHRFCEDHRIPSVFPITDYPVLSETDWYTVYLSKGLHQEGETAARYLQGRSDLPAGLSIVQVYRKERAGNTLSRAFQETWQSLGRGTPSNIALEQGADAATIAAQFAALDGRTVVIAWLDADDFSLLETLTRRAPRPALILVSSTLLGQQLYSLPDAARASVYITYPYSLPQEVQQGRTMISTVSRTSAVPRVIPDIKSKMQHVVATTIGPLTRMRGFVYREYFLELMETMPDQSLNQAAYPRISFGQGQRYASKGCYIVQLSEGPEPILLKKTDWVIY